MSVEYVSIIGYLAAVLTSIAFLPQVVRTYRTQDVSGISLPMYGLMSAGVALWIVYGICLRAWPIVLANGTSMALALSVLCMKILFSRTVNTIAINSSSS